MDGHQLGYLLVHALYSISERNVYHLCIIENQNYTKDVFWYDGYDTTQYESYMYITGLDVEDY